MRYLKHTALSLILLAVLGLGPLGPTAVHGEGFDPSLFVDEVTPSEVRPGDLVTVHGSFYGVTSASMYLSDGFLGAPIEVLEVSETTIVGRAPALPWPLVGSIHVMVHDSFEASADETFDHEGQTIELINAALWKSTRRVSGGTLIIDGSVPPKPPMVFGVYNDGLGMGPDGPCGSDTTALILIEPDLSAPNSLPAACLGVVAQLTFAWQGNSNMTTAAFYSAVASGFNQKFSDDGVLMAFDPQSGNSSDGSLTITLPGCPKITGSAVLLCI